MLRVGLDLRATEVDFKAHFGRGTGRYATELAAALSSQHHDDCQIIPCGKKELGISAWEQKLVRTIPFGRQTLESQLLLPLRLKKLPIDLMHFFAHGDAPGWRTKPYVVTLLDLIPLRFPELYRANKSAIRYSFARYLERRALVSCCGVLAISKATKRDALEMLGMRPEDVFVTPLAVSANFKPNLLPLEERKPWREAVCREAGVDSRRPLLLYVGGIDPRKNVFFLLQLLKELVADKPDSPQLLLVGRHADDRQFERLKQEILRLALEKDVVLGGYVSEERLPSLYQAADIVLFPSLYEGFGLPVLEAMACGCVVAAGDNSSIPEVAGEDYPLLPDNDRKSWIGFINELLADKVRREQLIRQGLQRAQQFTWGKTAELTYAAYRYFAKRAQPVRIRPFKGKGRQ